MYNIIYINHFELLDFVIILQLRHLHTIDTVTVDLLTLVCY